MALAQKKEAVLLGFEVEMRTTRQTPDPRPKEGNDVECVMLSVTRAQPRTVLKLLSM